MKRFIGLLAVVVLLCALSSCGPSKEDMLGYWVLAEHPASYYDETGTPLLLFAEVCDSELESLLYSMRLVDAAGKDMRELSIREVKGKDVTLCYIEEYTLVEIEGTLKNGVLTFTLDGVEHSLVRSDVREGFGGYWKTLISHYPNSYELNPDILDYIEIKDDGSIDYYFEWSHTIPAGNTALYSLDSSNGDDLNRLRVDNYISDGFSQPNIIEKCGPYLIMGYYGEQVFEAVDALPENDIPAENEVYEPYRVAKGFYSDNSVADNAFIPIPSRERINQDALSLMQQRHPEIAPESWNLNPTTSDPYDVHFSSADYRTDSFGGVPFTSIYTVIHASNGEYCCLDLYYYLENGKWMLFTDHSRAS